MSKPSKKSALSVQPGVDDAQPLNPNLSDRLKRSAVLSVDGYVDGITSGNR